MDRARRVNNAAGGAFGIRFWCAGCERAHVVSTEPYMGLDEKMHEGWTWNGSLERPTLSPSILILDVLDGKPSGAVRCHSFVKDGQIQYLLDCGHRLAGETVQLESMEAD